MSDTDCQRHRFACVEFISIVRGENDIYRRPCESSGFITEESLIHIDVFRIVFKYFSYSQTQENNQGACSVNGI